MSHFWQALVKGEQFSFLETIIYFTLLGVKHKDIQHLNKIMAQIVLVFTFDVNCSVKTNRVLF